MTMFEDVRAALTDGFALGKYYRARYYDPQISRFLSEDNNKDGVGGSLYAYADNSPTSLGDPMGTSGLVVGPNTKPEWVAAFNEGFVEALRRLNDPECRKAFCKKKNVDPGDVLSQTLRSAEYRILPFDNSDGAQTNPDGSVFINGNGPFVGSQTTLYIPSDRPDITQPRPVSFGNLADMRAFILLHELGHQMGVFGRDKYRFINGAHSLKVLRHCFKELAID